MRLPVCPGEESDGVTVKVPASLAGKVNTSAFEWGVPGHFAEKVESLLRALPKAYRKQLLPLSGTAEIVSRELPFGRSALTEALSRFLYRRFGVDVPASAWSPEALPEYLKLRIAVTGPSGETLRASRHATVLVSGMEPADIPGGFARASARWEREAVRSWDFGDLPETVELTLADGRKWTAYPALDSSENGEVALRLFPDPVMAAEAHRSGVVSLFLAAAGRDLKYIRKALMLPAAVARDADYLGGASRLEDQVVRRAAREFFREAPRTRSRFETCRIAALQGLHEPGMRLLAAVSETVSAYRACREELQHLESADSKLFLPNGDFDSLRQELSRLVPENFVALYDLSRIRHLPRFIRAVSIRAQRRATTPDRDRIRSVEIQEWTDILQTFLQEMTPLASARKKEAIEDFFWLIEEYKVALFAQELKTSVPVSRKRLDQCIREIRRIV